MSILPVRAVKPHEEVDDSRLWGLMLQILRDGFLRKSIAVDANTLVVLDGHHRLKALSALGCSRVPCTLFDYRCNLIEVWSFPGRPRVTKDEVVSAARLGKLFPPRTTRHVVNVGGKYVHISEFEEDVYAPLDSLR